jgi:hypothetical protein
MYFLCPVKAKNINTVQKEVIASVETGYAGYVFLIYPLH